MFVPTVLSSQSYAATRTAAGKIGAENVALEPGIALDGPPSGPLQCRSIRGASSCPPSICGDSNAPHVTPGDTAGTNSMHPLATRRIATHHRRLEGSSVLAERSRSSRLERAVNTEVDQTERTDEQLAAEAAREGSDGPAFAELVRRLRDPVWRICFRLMGNEHDAADAAQEVFVRLFFNRDKFAGRSKYTTWAHSVAVRTCLAMRRARGRRERRVASASDEMIEQEAAHEPRDAAANHLDLTQMLDVLDESDRAMLLLKYAENYSHEDLAEMFDISISACKMRISRAREKVKEKFGDQGSGVGGRGSGT